MFCSKCGKEITSADKVCPFCGAENLNYKETVAPSSSTVGPINGKEPRKKKNNIVPIIAALIVAGIVAVGTAAYFFVNSTSTSVKIMDKNELKKRNYSSLTDGGDAAFFINEELITFEGDYTYGYCSPDGNKFVLSSSDDKVIYYPAKDAEPISLKGRWASGVLDDGCFISDGSYDEGYTNSYYSFESGETIDLGFDATFSSNGRVAVGITKEGELKKYIAGNKEIETLGTINKEAKLCGVSNSGELVIWYTEDDGISIFMMINGVPERIGKLGKASEYGYMNCIFINDDKQFIAYYSSNNTMLYYQGKDDIQILALPNAGRIDRILDQNGDSIADDDAKVSELYITSSYNNAATLARMNLDGAIESIVSDMGVKDYSPYDLVIKDGYVIYVDKNKDLCKKKIGNAADQSVTIITTEVNDVFHTYNDAYVYIVKDNNLYSLDLNDDQAQLNKIAQQLGDIYSIYPTEEDSIVFYITNKKEIEDSYRTKGTLYMYTIGSEPIQVAENVFNISSNPFFKNNSFISKTPIIDIYKSHSKNKDDYNDYKGEIGYVIDSKYKQLVDNAIL